jgi:prolyl-tRNA synthetase
VLGADVASGIRYLVDPRVVDGTRVGHRRRTPGNHVVNLVAGRDFTPDGTIEAAEVRAGDVCPACGAALEIARGIEIGHIFQLGRKYAEALGSHRARRARQAGDRHDGLVRHRRVPGVAAIAEATTTTSGWCWPREIAPADVHLVIAGKAGGPQGPGRRAARRRARGRRPAGAVRRPHGTSRSASSSRTPN